MAKNFYTVTPSSDRTYRITSPERVFMDLFIGEHHALLLDTGHGLGDLKAAVRASTDKPLIIVNTHGHYDHSNGNYLFKGLPVYMNKQDWPIYDFYCQEAQRRTVIQNAQNCRLGWNSDKTVNILPDNFNEDAYIHAHAASLIPMAEDNVFDLGGLTLRVIETPGHTPGSCALLHEETGDLYIGDAANGHMVMTRFNAPMDNYIQTLEKLKALDFTRMQTSHDKGWLDKSVLDDYLDCALHPDKDTFIQVARPLDPEQYDYMYIRHGYTAADSEKPGFASIIVPRLL